MSKCTFPYIHIHGNTYKGGLKIKVRYDSTYDLEFLKKIDLFIINSDGKIKNRNEVIQYLARHFLDGVTPDDVLNDRKPKTQKSIIENNQKEIESSKNNLTKNNSIKDSDFGDFL